MKKINLKKPLLFLAYDQGLEHGPTDFNDKNVDPKFIIDIAKKAKVSGIIFQKGIAEKYKKEIQTSKIPLIIKLNGKTKLYKGEPFAEQVCSVDEAIKLGASAVGYTIYIGSQYENKMFKEFGRIEKKAHKKGLLLIAWVYPRGKAIKKDTSKENMAYATRTGLELGADIVKIKYGGKPQDLAWAVKAAGKAKVVVAGGTKQKEKAFLKEIKQVKKTGAAGFAIGRNIWQNKNPIEFTKKILKSIN